MEIRAKLSKIVINENLKAELVLEMEKIGPGLEKLKDKVLEISLKEYKGKRSIDANDYYWKLLRELKDILNIKLEDLHYQMLSDYGVGVYIRILKEGQRTFESMTKYYEKIDEIEEFSNGKRQVMIDYLVYKNSSEMDSKEFWVLMQGVIQECEQVGIYTIERKRIEEMIKARENVTQM